MTKVKRSLSTDVRLYEQDQGVSQNVLWYIQRKYIDYTLYMLCRVDALVADKVCFILFSMLRICISLNMWPSNIGSTTAPNVHP
jgi:hypothetical protein